MNQHGSGYFLIHYWAQFGIFCMFLVCYKNAEAFLLHKEFFMESGTDLVNFDPDRMLRTTNLSFTFHTQVKNLAANTSDLKSPRADASFTWKDLSCQNYLEKISLLSELSRKNLSCQNFLEKASPARIQGNCLALASCPTTRSSSATPSSTSMIKFHIRKLFHPTSCPTSWSPWSTLTRAGPLVSNFATISNSLFNIKVCFYHLPLQELQQQCQHHRLLLQYLASHNEQRSLQKIVIRLNSYWNSTFVIVKTWLCNWKLEESHKWQENVICVLIEQKSFGRHDHGIKKYRLNMSAQNEPKFTKVRGK